jgi:hypothetical protein
MVYNVTTSRQTIRHAYISTLKKLGFEGEKGQLREWMTVARDRSAWGRKVTPSPGLIHESPQTLNETRTIFDKLASTVDLTVRKQTTNR